MYVCICFAWQRDVILSAVLDWIGLATYGPGGLGGKGLRIRRMNPTQSQRLHPETLQHQRFSKKEKGKKGKREKVLASN